jgi:hypothetical protein
MTMPVEPERAKRSSPRDPADCRSGRVGCVWARAGGTVRDIRRTRGLIFSFERVGRKRRSRFPSGMTDKKSKDNDKKSKGK